MFRYIRLYRLFMAQYLKSLIEYRGDFILGLTGFLLIQGTGIIFLQLVFSTIPSLQGFSYYEILFIYGFAQIPRGIDHIFTDYLWIFSWKTIAKGEFDRYLLRPLNPLFQVLAERFQPDGFGELLMGIILLVSSILHLQITIDFIWIVQFMVVSVASTLIYTSIKLAVASIAFWVTFAQSYLYATYTLSTFAKYPMSIYPESMKFALTYIIPFALTGYYPAAYFLGKEPIELGLFLPILMAFITFTIAYQVWRIGMNRYESTGN